MKRYRGDSGLTTLEWLLIVAAVAGLAALAVVLVQNVVDDTAEEISGNNARITAAKVAADQINSDTIDEFVRQGTTAALAQTTYNDIDSEFESKCARLEITYSDAEVTAKWSSHAYVASSGADLRAALDAQTTVGCSIPD